MAKRTRRTKRMIEPIDAEPEELARALFEPNDRRARAAAKARSSKAMLGKR